MSQPPSLFRAFATVGSYTALSRVAGFIRDTLQAAFLGATPDFDAFVMAFTIPNLFRSLFAEGAFSAGFVPIFAQTLQRDGRGAAKRFADDAYSALTAVLLIFSVVMMLAMPLVVRYIIAPGFAHSTGQVSRATELSRIAFPYLFFISLTALQAGVLNALGRFAVAAAAPILLNVVLIAALLAGVGAHGDRAVFLSWGVSAAGVAQFIWLALDCRRVDFALSLHRPKFTPEVRRLLARTLPVAFGAGIYQVNVAVNRTIASLVGPGAVSWIYYADRITQLPVGIFGIAIGSALMPLVSRHIEAGNENAARHNQNRAIEISLLLSMPAAAGAAILAGPIISVLFEHGSFSGLDRDHVAAALVFFAIGLPAYVLNKALTPGFFGRHDTRTPVMASIAALALNIIVNVGLMHKLGHVAIALGTSVSAWLNAVVLGTILYRRGHLVPDARLKTRLPRMFAATLAMAVVLWFGLHAAVTTAGPVFGVGGSASGPLLLRASLLALLVGGGLLMFGAASLGFGAAKRSDLDLLRRSRPGALPVEKR